MLTAKEDQVKFGNVIFHNNKKILTITKKYVKIFQNKPLTTLLFLAGTF